MVYEYKGGRRFKVEAEVVGREVERIASANPEGVCSPGELVKAARAKRSPIHGLFTWDDAVAADAYRRQEARIVINNLTVVIEGSESRPPAFVHVKVTSADGEKSEGYADTMRVVLDPDLRQQVLDEALRFLHGIRRRYESISELGPVWEALDEVAGLKAS